MDNKDLENQNETIIEIEEKPKKEKKDFKKIIADNKKTFKAVVAIIVVIALVLAGFGIMSSASVRQRMVCSMVPNTITEQNDHGTNIVFYSELNKDYNDEEKDYMQMFNVYYYPDNDKSQDKVYLENGIYNATGQNEMVTLGFLVKAQQKYNHLKTALVVIAVLLALAAVVAVVYVLYLKDKKRVEEEKKRYKKSQNK